MGNIENVTRKDKPSVKLLLYIVCAVMIASYLIILFLSIKPKVPLEYKMYYITHELKSWPGYGGLLYKAGTKEYCTEKKDDKNHLFEHVVCARYGDGWKLEKRNINGVHMKNDSALLYYVSDGMDSKVCVKAEIRDYTGEGDVNVYINDVCVGSFNSSGEYTFSEKEISIQDGEQFTVRLEKSRSDIDFGLWSIIVSKC